MKSAGVRRIILLTLGWEELPKSISVHGDTSGTRLREPVPGVLLECDGGWLLLDTGFNSGLIRDPALYSRFHGQNKNISAILPGPDEPLESALEREGIDFDHIVAVALSHLHNDHAGGLRHFAARDIPIYAQQAEYEYGFSQHPGPEHHAIFRIDYDDPRISWELSEGDVELAPGVQAVLTAGHTPGHQSFVVSLDESVGGGGFVFAFDAADLTENIEEELAVGGFINCDSSVTIDAIKRLKAIAAEKDFRLIPGHDPVVWPALTDEFANRWSPAS